MNSRKSETNVDEPTDSSCWSLHCCQPQSPIFGIKAAQGLIQKMNQGEDAIDLSAKDPSNKW